MKDLPEGAVEVQPVERTPIDPNQLTQQDRAFEGLDLDMSQVRANILGQSPDQMEDKTGTEEEQQQEQSPTPGTHEQVGQNAERPDAGDKTPEQLAAESKQDEDEGDIPNELLDATTTEQKSETEVEELSEEDKELTKDMGEKQKEAFIQMRRELAELRKAKGGSEELQRQLEETQQKLSRYNLAEDPKFRQKFTNPIVARHSEAVAMVKQFGGDEALVTSLLKMNLKQRIETINDQVPELASILPGYLNDITRMSAERMQALKDHQETQKSLAQEAKAVEGKVLETSLNTATELLRSQNHFLLKTVEGNEKWNTSVAERVTRAKALSAAAAEPAGKAELALRAALADEYRDLYLATSAKLRAITGKADSRRRGSPGVTPSRTPQDESSSPRERPQGGMSADDVGRILSRRDYSHIGGQ